ncbi:MAG: hypothetical protein LBF41_05355 [Deltaproteobacteria bacterium]|nr:hypothetical protein [Deltaproteobacteria bacterium]
MKRHAVSFRGTAFLAAQAFALNLLSFGLDARGEVAFGGGKPVNLALTVFFAFGGRFFERVPETRRSGVGKNSRAVTFDEIVNLR